MRALIVDPIENRIPAKAHEVIRAIGWEVTSTTSYADGMQAASSSVFDALIVPQPKDSHASHVSCAEYDALIDFAEERRMAAVVLADHADTSTPGSRTLVDTVSRSISAPELTGRLEVIARYQPVIERMEREIGHMQKLTGRLNSQFREVEQEMRLAGRLQRDFLPQLDEPIENVQFAAAYRPALWVSGDTYDVFRVSETITGFYVADVVGHGMAASLLTMFIRRAIVAKRIDRDGFRILTPSETLADLNDALLEQRLPNSQFVTACYGLLDHRTLTVQLARGGHPYPLLASADGELRELGFPGGLLGVFSEAEFPTYETTLSPGDKLLIYTDGLEMAVDTVAGKNDGKDHLATLKSLATLPIRSMMAELESSLDRVAGSLDPGDDVTVVGLEVIER